MNAHIANDREETAVTSKRRGFLKVTGVAAAGTVLPIGAASRTSPAAAQSTQHGID
jgi:nitrous oxide reductase